MRITLLHRNNEGLFSCFLLDLLIPAFLQVVFVVLLVIFSFGYSKEYIHPECVVCFAPPRSCTTPKTILLRRRNAYVGCNLLRGKLVYDPGPAPLGRVTAH